MAGREGFIVFPHFMTHVNTSLAGYRNMVISSKHINQSQAGKVRYQPFIEIKDQSLRGDR